MPPAEGNPGTALNTISIPSSTPPSAVDQDSRMNSPESEESTHPATPPAGQHAAPDLPDAPEEIIIRGRNTTRMPRANTRRLSNASVWSHISEEPASSHSHSPTRFSSPPPAHATTNITQAVAGGAMPPPMSIQASNAKYGTELTSSLDINHEDQINLQTAALLTLQALDTGTAFKEGETAVSILTPQAWHRLVMATLVAIIRGHLRSPNRATNGNKSLNWSIDSFVVSPDIPKPLSEGGAIRSMSLQLAGYYDTKCANPLHMSPEEFFVSLVEKQTNTLQRITNRTAKLDQTVHSEITQNEQEMAQIRNRVKESIFNSLNAEALNDLDTWQDIYHEEFKIVMQHWIASNNFSSPDACFIKPDPKKKT
ncbi:hypothetical protein H4582DRAFT_2064500 [Lactarius indigo]|nr:hypothetical protein H4582DRAFT_2064500 [Lactarius indigo]